MIKNIDESILGVLRSNNDSSYVSSEELCDLAGVSRAAIWKHIEKLRLEGYEIEGLPHLGYRLVNIPDTLIPAEVKWRLRTKLLGSDVISYKKVDSTNNVLYDLAKKGLKEGAVVLAEEQTDGKGRQLRHWASPAGGGIYMSCLLRPVITPNEIPIITIVAAVAVAKAIREISGLSAEIKWPNDILMNDRKVCGILTEMKAEQDRVEFVIIGIGVNVNTRVKRLPKGASSLKEELRRAGREDTVSRIALTKRILENLESEYFILNKSGPVSIIDEWKHLSAMLGSRIKVVLPTRTFEAQAHTIDRDGALMVRLDSGIIEKVSSGDVALIK
jgi:BirA family biotin operon repressor/biotin-[acetyl-CoA-carboxylase] ligase